MAATSKIFNDPTCAVASLVTIGNDLAHQLNIVKEKRFTGTLAISIPERQWTLYFSLGDLIWADGGEHPQRRWRRLLFQYCFHNLPSPPLADYRERLCCLARWVQEGKLTKDALNPLVRSAAREILFDLLQQEFYYPYFCFSELPSKKLPIVARVPVLKVLEQMKSLWARWRAAKLDRVSPHAVVSLAIGSYKSRVHHIDKQIYLKLSRTVDGCKTIADLVLLWEKEETFCASEDPVTAVKRIESLSQKGWLRLHAGTDLIPNLPLQPLNDSLEIEASPTQLFLQTQITIPKSTRLLLPTAVTALAIALLGLSMALVTSGVSGILKLSLPAIPLDASSDVRSLLVWGERSRFAFLGNADFQTQMRSRSLFVRYFNSGDPNSQSALTRAGRLEPIEVRLSQFLHGRIEGKIVGVVTAAGQTDPLVLVASSRLHEQEDLVKTTIGAYSLNSQLDAVAALEWIQSGKLQRQIDAHERRLRQPTYDYRYLAAVIRDTAALFASLRAEDPQLAEALARKKYYPTFFER